jgi:sugar phosphate isomerase/epimerase
MGNLLAFSTLACPTWDIATVVTRAATYGYTALEWRGGDHGHVQPGMSAANKALLRELSVDRGLTAIAITAYTSFVSDNAAARQSNVTALCRYADLAADLGAQRVRAFVGELPPGVEPASVYARVADCLMVAAEYTQPQGVQIAVEPHDDFVRSSAIAPILRAAFHPALGAIWDIANAFSAGESPLEGHPLLRERLSYIQVKDGRGRGAQWQLTPLGEGEVPLRQAFQLLAADRYAGPISVEWEYAWHPELEAPEVALPRALQFVRGLWTEAQSTQRSEAP